MRAWILIVALAGCDKLLGLDDLHPPFVLAASARTLTAGGGYTCWIDGHGSLWCWGENDYGQVGNGVAQPEIDMPAPIDDNTYVQVSAAYQHTCAIRRDASLWCWGAGFDGRLGNGANEALTPVQVSSPSRWITVAAGVYHTCAIDDGHHAWCWGENGDGQLGDGKAEPSAPAPVEVGDDFAAIAVGEAHSCGIHSDGSLACWGDNGHGQLGDGTEVAQALPETIGSERWMAIAAGWRHTCGITENGHARCWGRNHVGQLGNSAMADATSPTPVLVDGEDHAGWLGIAVNNDHTCAWDDQEAGYCWGDGSHGELVVDGVTVNASPTQITGTFTAFAVGPHHVCGVDKDAGLECAGANGWGQLGSGARDTSAPRQVSSATWNNVITGGSATCTFDNSGKASCGGNNYYGQLGDGTRTSHAVLAQAAGMIGWAQLAAGDAHACGIDNQTPPVTWCWGNNESGQAGLSSGNYSATPMRVVLTAPTKISARSHTCAIDGSSLYCWGDNYHGELGDSTTTSRSTLGNPIANPNSANWAAITTGFDFTCALDSNGDAWCWGRNDQGSLGTNDMVEYHVPTQVAMAPKFSSIAAGGSHVCALDLATPPNAYCWGYNGEGQVGVGVQATYVLVPMQIPGFTWSSNGLHLGDVHTCGLASGNRLWCWGDNRRGQVGNGDPQRAAVGQPTQLGTGQWLKLAAGGSHTCAIDDSHALFCWGDDDDGALVDGGSYSTRLLPVPVAP
jgi:alpha-tubulin suppressor-like RCC1 family protein